MALLTTTEALQAIPELPPGAETTLLTQLVSDADAYMATWCRWKPATQGASPSFETATYTEYFNHETRPGMIQLPQKMVATITTIHDDPNWDYDAASLVAAGDYTLDERPGQVFLNPLASHSAWSRSRRAIKVVYVAGWDDTAAPTYVKVAAKRMVRWLYDRARQGIATSDEGTQYRPEEIPQAVKDLITGLRLWQVSIG